MAVNEPICLPARATEKDALSNVDVCNMLARLSPKIVAEAIKSSQCAFDVRADVLAELQSSGVPEIVILAMIRASRKRNRA
jgi:hypothetical protein